MLGFNFTNQFKKDCRLLEKRRYDLNELFDLVSKIIWEEPLPEHCREHRLSGDLAGFVDCHVKGDWVMLYYFGDSGVVFSRTGTHSDLL
jgi:mRNA interferase YafQ